MEGKRKENAEKTQSPSLLKSKCTFVLSATASSKQVTGFGGFLPNSYLCLRGRCALFSYHKRIAPRYTWKPSELPFQTLFSRHLLVIPLLKVRLKHAGVSEKNKGTFKVDRSASNAQFHPA